MAGIILVQLLVAFGVWKHIQRVDREEKARVAAAAAAEAQRQAQIEAQRRAQQTHVEAAQARAQAQTRAQARAEAENGQRLRDLYAMQQANYRVQAALKQELDYLKRTGAPQHLIDAKYGEVHECDRVDAEIRAEICAWPQSH